MNPKYAPKSDLDTFGYLVEECGEVLQAVGKALRWGLESANPELPEEQRETNRDWILRELQDVERAVFLMRARLEAR